MAKAFPTLTGRWLGRYEQRPNPAVPFEADVLEDALSLTGEIREPNSFRRDLGAELFATIVGGRSDRSVHFVKHYQGFAQGDKPVYEGIANAALTRIEGRWTFPKMPMLSGRFVMMRKPAAEAAAKQEQAADQPERVE